MELTQSYLREVFDFDGQNLVWKQRRKRVIVGTIAGGICPISGYRNIRLDKKAYRAHRLIWLWQYGSFPINEIDHINGKRYDNRLENLREATHHQNSMNLKLSKKNSSGFKGVSWDKYNNKWRSHISVFNKMKNLGRFEKIEDAIAARKNAEDLYFGIWARK